MLDRYTTRLNFLNLSICFLLEKPISFKYLLISFTDLAFSFTFFPPEVSLVSSNVQNSFSLFLYLLYDFILILLEIELLLIISRKIDPPLKFGFLSLLLSLIGILLIKFVYGAGVLIFIKRAGEPSISLLYLFYSRQQILVFLFFGFLITFAYLTYVLNRIKNLLETFPKEEENVVTKK